MLMIDGRPKLWKLCIIRTCPRCRLCIMACSISSVKKKNLMVRKKKELKLVAELVMEQK